MKMPSIGAVIKSMQTADSSCIIIIKNNKISGIFTERDVVTKIVAKKC